MYKLFYYPNNANLAPHMILEELGVPFELELVDRKSEAQKSADYLKLNPAGRIPTLVDGELVLFESPAICLYLAEKHPQGGLMPPIGTPERAKFYQWMMYLTNTLQAELMVYFYPEKHTRAGKDTAAIRACQEERITGMLALLNAELAGRPYLTGDTISVCDFFLFMLCIWADEFDTPPLAFDHLRVWLRRVAEHEGLQRACSTEKIELAPYLP